MGDKPADEQGGDRFGLRGGDRPALRLHLR
jgi:hypothetical protein